MGRVLVLGNAGMDLSLPVARLPRPGETLVAGAPFRAPGGKGLNQAVVAARAGAAVRFLAPVGDDADGAEVRRRLAGEPFEHLELRIVPAATDLSVLIVDAAGENCIVSTGAAAAALTADDAAGFAGELCAGDVLLVQGNLSHEATRAALAEARRRGAETFLNPAPLLWDARALLPLCTVVVANAGEAEAIAGCPAGEAAARLRALGAGVAVVTLGGDGCSVAAGDRSRHHPAVPAVPLDTTGAGDAFCGAAAAMIAMGRGLPAALDAALRAGALTVARRGAFAALPTADELFRVIADATG